MGLESTIVKHAHLIVCHGQFDVLCKLVSMLDDVRHDIFIHLDKKVKVPPIQRILQSAVHSTVRILDNRVNVKWGHSSLVHAELELYKAAYREGNYQYFHLHSGVDLPLHSCNDIYNFFEKHKGKIFMEFETIEHGWYIQNRTYPWKHPIISRVALYWFSSLTFLNRGIFQAIQGRLLRINRLKGFYSFGKGSEWCSLPREAVKYLLDREVLIKRMVFMTSCADEIYKHTLLLNSPLRDDIVNLGLTYMDWSANQPHPLVLTKDHYEAILNVSSFRLFARKFSYPESDSLIELLDKRIGL